MQKLNDLDELIELAELLPRSYVNNKGEVSLEKISISVTRLVDIWHVEVKGIAPVARGRSTVLSKAWDNLALELSNRARQRVNVLAGNAEHARKAAADHLGKQKEAETKIRQLRAAQRLKAVNTAKKQ